LGDFLFFAILSDKPEARERFCKLVGKETGKEDVSFYSVNYGGKINTLVEPTFYPQKIQPLVFSLYLADYVVVIAEELTPQIGEIIVALDALGKDRGMLITQLDLPIKGTVLEKYEKVADEATAKQKLLEMKEEPSAEDELLAFIDKYLSVKSVGNVALGAVKEGKMKKHDKIFYLPDKKEMEIRTVQINDVDVEEAKAGDRFGIAYKGEPIDRGMAVSLRSEFESGKDIMGKFQQSQFYKDDINRKLHFCYGFNMVEGKVLENSISLDREMPYRKRDPFLVLDPSNQKLRIVGSFTPI
jgi:selenocysteine-specific translation elongation factor